MESTSRLLKNRTALVTGASKGLGRAMAISLAAAGARLALVSRDLEKLAETAEAVRAHNVDVEVFEADISQEDQVIALESNVRERLGDISVLINNAGINVRKPVTDFTLDEWNLVIGTNLTGAFLMCRSFVPHMKGKGYGRILNLTSIMGHVSLPGRAAYSASKSALLGLTRALALELASDHITVVGISPGPFATEMNASLIADQELNRQFLSSIPVGTWGQVTDIGELAVFLCSDAAAFITGTDIVIDGGWCAR